MGIKVDLEKEMIVSRLKRKNKKAQIALDAAVISVSNYYCPQDTGNLQNSAILGSKLGSGVIKWNAQYAKKLYYGEGYKFSKDKNPNASAKWFERAKAQYKKAWETVAKEAFKRG